MGDAYFHLGQLDEAEKSYQKSLSLGEDLFALTALICLNSCRQDWHVSSDYFWRLIAAANSHQNPLELLLKRFVYTGKQPVLNELFCYLLETGDGDQAVLAEVKKQLARLS
jgi:tetratricopeptide (TPR) repeat protein